MANKRRAQQFRKDLLGLLGGLSMEQGMALVQDKLLDAVSRNLIDPGYLQSVVREVARHFKPEYVNFVREALGKYNAIIEIVNSHYTDIGVEVSRDWSAIRALEEINRTRLGAYEELAARDIARTLRKNLLDGKDFKSISKELNRIGGKVSFYSDTIARTQAQAYSREAVKEKANIAEVIFYQYVGIIRRTTRVFCRHVLNRIHTIDEINRMRNANLEPIITYGGGWNCHHNWEPDPFATESDGGRLVEMEAEGGRMIRVFQ